MEQSDIEMLVGELETRMERLRALYDMYFMGIERIEPLVPKKDVERRMQALRKEQIRNTGLRFKFQTVIQRFNTYQTYWLRISRQIEQGTYARDVRRAAARFGVDPAKERANAPAGEGMQDDAVDVDVKAFELPDELVPESGDSSLLEPLDGEDDPFARMAPPPRPSPSASRLPPERFASATRFELDDLADPFEEADPFPKPAGSPNGPKLRIAPRPGATKMPPPQTQEGHRDTERRIPIPGTSLSPSPLIDAADLGPGTLPGMGAGTAGRANEPRVTISKRPSMPDEAERGPSIRPFAPPPPLPLPPPSAGTLQRPTTLPSAVTPPGRVALPPQATRAPPPQATRAPPPQPSRAPSAVPVAPASDLAPRRPGTLPSAVVFTGSIPAGPLSAPPKPPAPRVSLQPANLSRPPPARPASPTVAPVPAAPPAAAPPRIGDLSGDRFGEIFSKYVETRQKQNEPTHAITRDALAKQLSESTQRLKQKHAGKAIDFEVVVKDGKTILRPVVK